MFIRPPRDVRSAPARRRPAARGVHRGRGATAAGSLAYAAGGTTARCRAGPRQGRIPCCARAVRALAATRPLGRGVDACGPAAQLAALHRRPLGLHRRLGLVLGLGRAGGAMGLGRVPLWPLDLRRRARLVLGARRRMESRLGAVAPRPARLRLCGMGAVAARRPHRRVCGGAALLDLRARSRLHRPENPAHHPAGRPLQRLHQ